jgi:hypothetical protein
MAAAAAAAVGSDMLAVGSAGRRDVSMDVVIVAAGAEWFATTHAPWTRHWRAAEGRELSSRG